MRKRLFPGGHRLAGWCAVLSFAVIAISSVPCKAEDVIVTHNVNLRQGPGVDQPIITLLKPPTRLALVEPQPTNDFFHVRNEEEDEEGWVWTHNVRLVPVIHAFDMAVAVPGGAADSISSSWDKPEPDSRKVTIDGETCGPKGDGEDPDTAFRKNRIDVPSSYHDVAWKAIAEQKYPKDAKTSRENWTQPELDEIAPFEGVAIRTIGYIVAIRPQGGSGESCNCHQTGASQTDWHIALVEDFGDGEKTAVVVETTPRVRRKHPGWKVSRLETWRDSKDPVRISGWLMMDPKHKGHLKKYRSTLWEIHPITRIEGWKDGKWIDLDTAP